MLPVKLVKRVPHIVLVNDDAHECLLFEDALSQLEVPSIFSTARNGETLLNMLDSNNFNPDYILLDLHNASTSGEECLNSLKTWQKLESVPIILYSASVNPDDKDYCYNANSNEYFLKALHFML